MKRSYITEEHEMYRKALRAFLEKEAVPYIHEWEKNKEIPRSFWKKLGENGFLCPQFDEAYGGLNTDFGFSVISSEEFDRVSVGLIGVGLHNDIVMPYIESLGTKAQKEKWMKKATTGELISAIAMTEPNTGSDLAAISTTAIKDGDDYIINGEKTFITNGYTSDIAIVVCKTDPKVEPAHRGISLIVVEAGTSGFTKGKKLNKVGQHESDTCELIFNDVRVPKENLLGEENKGFYYLMQHLQQERLMVTIQSIASAELILEKTIAYVTERKAFGKQISQFQNTQFKLAELQTEITIGRTFVDRLINEHMDKKDIVTEVSMAKWWVTDLVKKVAAECMQLHGGYGYMEEYEVAKRYRDVAVSSIYAGSNEIMKVIIAGKMGLN
ncbi:MAG TPA: acyl-CoA dehydrogenase family protein [Pseudogracilibacillus sp.]|nr:acyl-CoA dehydrogenase family protein [Pseudogracilibacillus sp.]